MADIKLTDVKLNNLAKNEINSDKQVSKPKKSFIDTMKQTIDEVNAYQKDSQKALADVATGQIKDLHQAAIAIGKAETSMKVMLEVRNKAINAYREISRTQI